MSHNNNKRSLTDISNPSPEPHSKRPLISATPTTTIPPATTPVHQLQKLEKRQTFTSYHEVPNLPPKIKILCEILATTPSSSIDSALNDTGIRITTQDVEEVLKLSYSYPGAAVKFFRWAGHWLTHNHSPYSWNLVVDLLGKNLLFDAMWDAIKSMRSERLISLATFASVFSSYVAADRVDEACMTFEVLDQHGCPRDVVALNSLLSAICRHVGKTNRARMFFDTAKSKIHPDADTFAILLEGWENEGDTVNAKNTFDEMVAILGWDPANVPAYDSFLNTLLRGTGGAVESMKYFDVMRDKRCLPGMKFFRNALEEFSRLASDRAALTLWDVMTARNHCCPDTQMYNTMIALQCNFNHVDFALRLSDEMALNGAFPDTQTYNVLFQFLIKSRKLREASSIFDEMVKNECFPNHTNCMSAVRVYLDSRNPDMALRIWKCMVKNDITPLEEISNLLVLELPHAHRLQEAAKYAEDMIERGIKLNSSTLSKLKQSLIKVGRGDTYDQLLRKWKSH